MGTERPRLYITKLARECDFHEALYFVPFLTTAKEITFVAKEPDLQWKQTALHKYELEFAAAPEIEPGNMESLRESGVPCFQPFYERARYLLKEVY